MTNPNKPTAKVAYGALGGAITSLLVALVVAINTHDFATATGIVAAVLLPVIIQTVVAYMKTDPERAKYLALFEQAANTYTQTQEIIREYKKPES